VDDDGYDLFGTRWPARRTDPSTSHEGAASILPTLSERHHLIEDFALRCAVYGVTAFEVTERFGDGWWKRLSELGQHGRLIATAHRRRNPRTGIRAVVWIHNKFYSQGDE